LELELPLEILDPDTGFCCQNSFFERQCLGSGFMRNWIDLASWIWIRVDLDFLDPGLDTGELKWPQKLILFLNINILGSLRVFPEG